MRSLLVAAALLTSPSAGAESDKPAIKYPAQGSGVAIELSNGSIIKGVYDGQREGAVWVKQDKGEVGIEPATIASISAEDTPTAEFQRRVAAVDAKDAAALWKLASWAAERGLDDSALELAGKVVKLEPDHAEARAFLGHQKVGAEWLGHDEAMRARGFVEHDGRWVSQESYEQILRDEQEQESQERIAQLKYNRWYYYRYSDPSYRVNRGMAYRQAMLNNPTALWEPYRFTLSGTRRRR